MGVQTGGCPHTAIREDSSLNQEAAEDLCAAYPDLELLFIESGGDNLASSFSPELVDAWMFVVDVAGGEKVPRKGGPGVRQSDLLIINKTDLAPLVGADLAVMDADARAGRTVEATAEVRPYVFTNLKSGEGLSEVIAWIEHDLLFQDRPAPKVGL